MPSAHFLDRSGDPRIAYWVDAPAGAPRGRVLLVHGYAEHSARYERIVEVWRERGLAVARLDLRGHGRSEGARGHVAAFDDYVRDVRDVLAQLERQPLWRGGRSPVLFGHSLGGLVASHAALALGDGASGLALTSPFFGLEKPIPGVQRLLAGITAKIAPGLRQPSGLSGSDLTHVTEIASSYDADPLGFRHVTVGWFLETARAQERLLAAASRIRIPVFCIAAGEDRVVSVATTRRFFELVGATEKELDVRAGLFHEVLNEADWKDHAIRLGDRMLGWAER